MRRGSRRRTVTAMSKNRIAAALSLSGVLLAGTAAALVNSQVLSSNSSEASAAVPAVAAPAAAEVTVVATAGPVSVADTTPSPTQADYQVGDAGWVVLDTAAGALTVVNATPSDGWLVVAVVQEDALQVRVEFQSYTTLVTFRANALFGVVATSVEVTEVDGATVPGSVNTTPGSGSTTPGSVNTTPESGSTVTTVDDDDDDDDTDDEDDDDDEQEDD